MPTYTIKEHLDSCTKEYIKNYYSTIDEWIKANLTRDGQFDTWAAAKSGDYAVTCYSYGNISVYTIFRHTKLLSTFIINTQIGAYKIENNDGFKDEGQLLVDPK